MKIRPYRLPLFLGLVGIAAILLLSAPRPYEPRTLRGLPAEEWTHQGVGRTPYTGPPQVGLPRSRGKRYRLDRLTEEFRRSLRADLEADGFRMIRQEGRAWDASRGTETARVSIRVVPGGYYDFEPDALVHVSEWKVTEAYELPSLWFAYGVGRVRAFLSLPHR